MYRRTKDCTAMIVYNDEVAGYYMEFLEERGLHVPEDVSLVSFDDEELQQDARVKVLSVVHPKYNLGRITGKNLLRMMDDPDWQNKNYSSPFSGQHQRREFSKRYPVKISYPLTCENGRRYV